MHFRSSRKCKKIIKVLRFFQSWTAQLFIPFQITIDFDFLIMYYENVKCIIFFNFLDIYIYRISRFIRKTMYLEKLNE
jgi:hypothetical protein